MTKERNPMRSLIAIRMADEGIPFCAIKRVLQMTEEDLKDDIDYAIYTGKLDGKPPYDWPKDSTRLNRRPVSKKLFSDETSYLMLANAFGITPSQAKLFEQLLRHEVVTKGMLYSVLSTDAGIKIIDVYMFYLRKRLQKLHPQITIKTVWGIGYSLEKSSAEYIRAHIDALYQIPVLGEEENARIPRYA